MKVIDTSKEEKDLFVDRGTELLPANLIANCRSYADAYSLTLHASPVQDQQLSMETGIDQAIISKGKNGQRPWIREETDLFMRGCGNVGILQYMAKNHGYGLVRLQTEVERENERLKAELQEKESKLKHFEEFMKLAK